MLRQRWLSFWRDKNASDDINFFPTISRMISLLAKGYISLK